MAEIGLCEFNLSSLFLLYILNKSFYFISLLPALSEVCQLTKDALHQSFQGQMAIRCYWSREYWDLLQHIHLPK